MSFLQDLHGVVAVVLLCGLLFAEEAGVPLPFAPGELVLLGAGLLIAAGGLDPVVFVPLAIVSCLAGSMVGFSWARLVGEHGLAAVAKRLHQTRNLERVSARIRSSGWLGVAITRLIPGLRIYTTLVAGAVRVRRRTFVAAMVPSTILWVAIFVTLGAFVGLPVERFFNQLEKLALQGGILIVMGVGCFLAIRRTPPSNGAGLTRMPRPYRALIAAGIDLGIVASIMTGMFAVGRRVFGIGLGAGWIDAAAAVAVPSVAYIVIARRGAGGTVGEALMQTSYVSRKHLPLRPQDAWRAAREMLGRSADELRPTADLLRALADPDRLRLVRHLLDEPCTVDKLAMLTHTEKLDARHRLERLQEAGILAVQPDGDRVSVRPDLLVPMIEFLSAAGVAAVDESHSATTGQRQEV